MCTTKALRGMQLQHGVFVTFVNGKTCDGLVACMTRSRLFGNRTYRITKIFRVTGENGRCMTFRSYSSQSGKYYQHHREKNGDDLIYFLIYWNYRYKLMDWTDWMVENGLRNDQAKKTNKRTLQSRHTHTHEYLILAPSLYNHLTLHAFFTSLLPFLIVIEVLKHLCM